MALVGASNEVNVVEVSVLLFWQSYIQIAIVIALGMHTNVLTHVLILNKTLILLKI